MSTRPTAEHASAGRSRSAGEEPGALRSYLLAVLVAAAALIVVRALEDPFAGLFYSVPLLAVVFSGLAGSVATSLLTGALCALGLAFLPGMRLELRVEHSVETYRFAGFLVTSVVSALVSGGVSKAYRRAHEARRTAEEARARAEAASAEAREIGQLQEQLMAVVGHDLRTPLSAVRLSSTLLLRGGSLAADQRRHVERIATSSARMARMISDLIDFSRVRRGQALPMEKEPVNLSEICRCGVSELQQVHPDRRIVAVAGDASDATGEGDPDRLLQVVSNLIGNALQHGAPDQPVEVAVERRDSYLVLTVHNRGPAIAPEQIPSLFEPFRRGRSDAEGARRGSSGLGLFIVREVVTAHGGTIDVRSDERAGTTFTVRLPATQDDRVGCAAGGEDRRPARE